MEAKINRWLARHNHQVLQATVEALCARHNLKINQTTLFVEQSV